MATANFYLKNPTAKTETPVNLMFRYNGQKLKYAVGEKIKPRHWNEISQRAKKSFVGYEAFNDYLDSVAEEAQAILRNANATGKKATPNFIREKLNLAFNKEPQTEHTFFSLFEHFISQSKATKKNSTVKSYQTTLNFIRAFSNSKRYSISFESMTHKFYEKFVNYLLQDIKQANNSVGKYIKTLKTFLNFAKDNGYNTTLDYMKFKVFHEETTAVSLTKEELQILETLDLSGNTKLNNVRDIFLFGCYTGQRYSDIAGLKPENIKGDWWILQTQKTKTNNSVALNELAKEVLERNGNRLPRVISNQKMNEYLKEICKKAGIKEKIEVTVHKGTNRIETTKPKYQLIGTHTARRTHITLSLEKGMRPEMVMANSGHKDYKTFSKYIKITPKTKLIEMKQFWNREPEMKAV